MTEALSLQERASSKSTSLAISPVTGAVGADVTGLDLRGDYSPAIRDALNQALHTHGVLFIRFDGRIEPADQVRLSSMFGELAPNRLQNEIPHVAVLDSDRAAQYGVDRWHADSTMMAQPPQVAALRAIVQPPVGGDTVWAGMYAAYDALSSRMQSFLQGLEAVHTTQILMTVRPAMREDNIYTEDVNSTHPVIIRDPVTQRAALYVNSNFCQSIVGLRDHESRSVLDMLFDHVNTPDFHVRLKWDSQTIAVWEQRITQHRGVNDYTGRRVMHRTTVVGGVPEPYLGPVG